MIITTDVTMAIACHRISRVCCQSHENFKPIIRHSPNGGVVSCPSAIDVNSGGVRGTSFFSANWSVKKAHRLGGTLRQAGITLNSLQGMTALQGIKRKASHCAIVSQAIGMRMVDPPLRYWYYSLLI